MSVNNSSSRKGGALIQEGIMLFFMELLSYWSRLTHEGLQERITNK